MTRKRFIKLLMARHLHRNAANTLAEMAREQGASYFKALGDFLTLCQIRAYNTWEDRVLVWQTAATNVWVGVLTT